MVDRLLDSLFALTLAFSAASLLVMLLREPSRRLFGSAFTYWLWLLVPLALAAALAPALPHPVAPAVPMQAVSQLAMAPVAAMQPQAPSLVESALAVLRDLAPYLLGAWGFGLLAFLCRIALLQRRFVEGLGKLTRDPGRPNVFYSAKPGVSPSVIGMLRSRIVLPANFADLYAADEQTLIMAHERTHVRERHPTAGALGVLIVAAQWFNPLAYTALTLFRIDQELACDAAVVTAHPSSRAAYAKAMLKARIGVEVNPPLAYCWTGRMYLPMKARIGLLKAKPPTRGQRNAAMAMLTVLASASAVAAYAMAPHTEILLSLDAASPAPTASIAPSTSRAELQAPVQVAASVGRKRPVVVNSARPSVKVTSVGLSNALEREPSDPTGFDLSPPLGPRDQQLFAALSEAAQQPGSTVAPPTIQTAMIAGRPVSGVGIRITPVNQNDLGQTMSVVDAVNQALPAQQ